MARATETSGKEMQAITRTMQEDAKLMRYLAEITTIFLPMTTVAVSAKLRRKNNCQSLSGAVANSSTFLQTIFSMGFFEVDSNSKGWMPTFPSFHFVWLYFATVVPISVITFCWLGYKHHKFRSARAAPVQPDDDTSPAFPSLFPRLRGS